MPRTGRRIGLVSVVAAAVAILAVACVDLFHSTDFVTLCAADAAACTTVDAGVADARVPDDAPAPLVDTDVCSWSASEARGRAERACAWLGACHGARAGSSFGQCMLRAEAAYDCKMNPSRRPQGRTRALWKCLEGVASCAAVSACVFGPSPATCGPVEGAALTICSGSDPSSSVLECTLPEPRSRPAAIEPCALEGRSCTTTDPSRASCAGKMGATCTGSPDCQGTYAVACDGTTDLGIDCAAFGSGRCVRDAVGLACAPLDDAGTCTGSAAVTCDDAGVAHSCVDGRDVVIDCTQLGQPCRDLPDASLDPVAACTDTSPSRCTGQDECAGDVLRSCAQGKAFEVHCSSLGLGACTKPPPGIEPIATCRKP